MFDTAEQAREYIRRYDRRVVELDRQNVAALKRIFAQSLAANGEFLVYGGPASKDEMVSAVAEQEYPRIAAARKVYVDAVTLPDYSQIPGFGREHSGGQLIDLDTGYDLSNPCVQDMEAQS